MMARKRILLIGTLLAACVLLTVVAGCSDGDGHHNAAPQNQSPDDHRHQADETHDDHDHDCNDHDKSAHDALHLQLDNHAEEGIVHLSAAERESLDMEIGEAQPGRLKIELSIRGEIRLNADRRANI